MKSYLKQPHTTLSFELDLNINFHLLRLLQLLSDLKRLEIHISSHWREKMVFSRQFVDVLNPFIGCQRGC